MANKQTSTGSGLNAPVSTAPTLDPKAPDVLATGGPAVILGTTETAIGALVTAPVVTALPPLATDIGSIGPGDETIPGSVDGVNGRGTSIESDRVTLPASDRLGYSTHADTLADPTRIDPAAARLASDARERAALDVVSEFVGSAPFVRVSCPVNRRRGGHAFGPTPVDIPIAILSGAAYRAIENDPMLSVKVFD